MATRCAAPGQCLSACYVVNGGVDIGTVAPIDAAGRCPTDPRRRLRLSRPGAAVEGKVKIPNLGPNRYALSVTPPDGSGWIQTTTLEGNHDWDAWVMEGATGLDTEFIIAGEPFPAIIFGYVPAPGTPSAVGSALPASLAAAAPSRASSKPSRSTCPRPAASAVCPARSGAACRAPRSTSRSTYPWVSLTDLGNGDTVVWVGKGDADGTFTIPNVPAGTYTLTWWDEPQNNILDLVNVTVGDGETVDMGILPLAGWWTFFDGYVFNDTNRNGVKDAGEPGLAGYTLTMRKRENSLMDRGTTVATTDANGYYKFEAAYPMTQWLVMEAYDDLHYTTGVTYQADNQPTPTTVLGAGVDVSVLPIIGLQRPHGLGQAHLRRDGRRRHRPAQRRHRRHGQLRHHPQRARPALRGGRRLAARHPRSDGQAVRAGRLRNEPLALPATRRAATSSHADGSFAKGKLLNTYLTETWQRPTGCVARDVDGTPLVHGVDEQVLPLG